MRPPAPAPAAARPAHPPAPAPRLPLLTRTPRPGPAGTLPPPPCPAPGPPPPAARPGPELAGDHHLPPTGRRHQPRHRLRLRRIVEYQQPSYPRPGQHAMHPPRQITPWPVHGAQVRGQLGQPRRQPGRFLGGELPHHPHSAACRYAYSTATLVLPAPPSPYSTTTPGPVPPPCGQPGLQINQQLLPARQLAPAGAPATPQPPTPHHPAPRSWPLWSSPGCGRVVSAWNSNVSSRSAESTRWTVIPAASTRSRTPLPLPVHRIRQQHLRQRQHRVLVQHGHQPRQAQLASLGELQLGIRTLRFIPHRRAVSEPDNPRIHIRPRDLLPAIPGRFVLAGSEIRHIQHHPARPGHRLLGRSHGTTGPPGTGATPTCDSKTPATAPPRTVTLPLPTSRENP